MKQMMKGDYLSPQTEVFGLRYEGVLCGSVEKEYGDSTNEGYSSTDDLFGIF